ncbi:MAG: cupredoxin domain-containing protein [Gaiellaceae bacterium]
MRRVVLPAGAAGFVLALAACGGGSSSGAAGGSPSGTATAASASKSATTVIVEESEYKLTLPAMSFKPGTYTFVAKNVGKVAHALEINGPGVTDTRTPGTVAPGQSAMLTVTLKSGSYELFCPVDGHKGLGMDSRIQSGAAAPGTTTKSGTTTGGGSTWG